MILRLEESELSPASIETPETLPEGRGLAVSQEWQPGLLIPHLLSMPQTGSVPGQELPSCSCEKNHSGCFFPSWTSISRTKSRVIKMEVCLGTSWFSPNAQLAGTMSL